MKTLKENWKYFLFLSFGLILLYLNSLKGNFVSDDYAAIANNTLIRDFFYGLEGQLVGVSNWFIAIIFGNKNPFFFHSFSLLLYILVCIFVFIFVNIIFGKKIAYFSSILFAVLPIHVESVSWISGKPYLWNGLSVLISLIFFIYLLKTKSRKYFWYFLLSLFFSFFAEKVRSLSLLFLIPLYLVSFKEKIKKIKIRRIIFFSSIILVLLLAVLWPQILLRIQSISGGNNSIENVFNNPFFQYPTSVVKYLQLIIFPIDLTLYHTMFVIPVWFNWIILSIYLLILIWSFKKDRKIFFSLAFIFAAMAPSMAPVKVGWLVAERYAFLGSLGFCMFLGILFDKFFRKNKVLSLVVFIFLITIYGRLVILRNIDWQTNHNLWVKTVQVSPNSHNAWNNIGDDYDKLKQFENSIKGFTQSTIIKPDYADALHNRANIFYKIGRLDLARDSYEMALKLNPSLFQTHLAIIQIDLIEKKYESAIQKIERLKELQPNNPQIIYVSYLVYTEAGQKENAKKILEEANELLKELKKTN